MPNWSELDPRRFFIKKPAEQEDPRTPLTRRQRRAQRFAKKSPQPTPKRPSLLTNLALAGSVTAGAVLGGVTYKYEVPQKVIRIIHGEQQSDLMFDGSIEQTAHYIQEWKKEVKNQQDFEKLAPRITQLATTYFLRQMQEMFPSLAMQYQPQDYPNFRILSPQAYDKAQRDAKCSSGAIATEMASTDPVTGEIDFSPGKLWRFAEHKNAVVETAFVVSLHELLHKSAKRINNGEGISMQVLPDPITFKKGLRGMTPDKSLPDRECYRSWWFEIEEIVVEHGATKLAERVGTRNLESGYMPWVIDYQALLDRQFAGRFDHLLYKQQVSDTDGFLAKIGQSFFREELPFEAQVAYGGSIMTPLADQKKLNVPAN